MRKSRDDPVSLHVGGDLREFALVFRRRLGGGSLLVEDGTSGLLWRTHRSAKSFTSQRGYDLERTMVRRLSRTHHESDRRGRFCDTLVISLKQLIRGVNIIGSRRNSQSPSCRTISCFGKRKYLSVWTGQKTMPKQSICCVLFSSCQSNKSLCRSGQYRSTKQMRAKIETLGTFCERSLLQRFTTLSISEPIRVFCSFVFTAVTVYQRIDAVVVITLLSVDLVFLSIVITAAANERYRRPATYVLATYNVRKGSNKALW